MKVKGTYLQDNEEYPIVYGDIEINNIPRKKLRGEQEKNGILAETVIAGFCGTDFELMNMGKKGELTDKFPKGEKRLINGHEGVVYIPSENRFAIVLIRGGDSYDPTRYSEDETYFEYGCDGADGLFSDMNYYHPDMLLPIPNGYVKDGKLALSFAKKMVFADPYSCMIFQLERMEDLGEAHNFRIEMAKHKCNETIARRYAKNNIFNRVVIFGLGTTGMFIGELIRKKYPDAVVLFVARSEENSKKVIFAKRKAKAEYIKSDFSSDNELAQAIINKLDGKATAFIGVSGTETEHKIAFQYGVLGCNGVYNSFSLGPQITFDSMPFGFQNHLILASINFRQNHMEEAIKILAQSNYDEIVELIEKDRFTKNPLSAYTDMIFSKSAPLKTAVLWNDRYINMQG